ncbi:efflux RND transporter periplasmic adaptor subunit [Snuella sedimenti]|uniref:HlyD family efflux transporter periplasmic adaptor subunit n=1 Tax=Snuella sedimenti TaxID=2798802 RepID=A0A8J7J4I6_9FLAO|nr:HlyD family efflux transporter periplasmic adaptor subunit [Snuella sedimenti]MBJ6368549.1 HlyD family efflux transporter periplasmic adaptor subunit [Snuella sedimenti]
MDTPIEKKKGIKRKHIIIGGLVAFVLYFISHIAFGDNVSTLKVDKEKLTIAQVIKDKFNDYISLSGQVSPITTVYLGAYEGGRVTDVLIEEGSMVKKGEVIFRLENRELYGQILNSETNLATKENSLRQTQIDFETKRNTAQKSLLDAEYRLKQSKRKYEQYQALYDDELIAREEFLRAKEDFELSQKSYEVHKFQTGQDSLRNMGSIKDLSRDLGRMKRALSMEYERIENLNVKAPIAGQLGFLDAEIGKQVGKGQNVGQINVLSDFKVESQIDEHYIDRVKRGLMATFDRNDTVYKLRLRKVYPEVRDGKFDVDLVFDDHKPANIRTGQSYYIKLQLGAPSEALLLPKGAFFGSTGGQWVYVVDSSGEFAIKRNVKIGKQNPQYYEIIEGLDASETVIISSYDNFGDNDKLILR